MRQIKQSDIDRYIASPMHCPFCETQDIEGGVVDIEDGIATQDVSCLECHEEWTDVYRVVNVKFYAPNNDLEIINDTEPEESIDPFADENLPDERIEV